MREIKHKRIEVSANSLIGLDNWPFYEFFKSSQFCLFIFFSENKDTAAKYFVDKVQNKRKETQAYCYCNKYAQFTVVLKNQINNVHTKK